MSDTANATPQKGAQNSLCRRAWRLLPAVVCVASVIFFLWQCAGYYREGKGFTAMVMFGDQFGGHALPELKATPHVVMVNSAGYDGQFYAQIAMRPDLESPELDDAVDNLAYRARRILFSWTAHVLAGGNAVGALHVYSVQNIVCWLLLGWLLLRRFPPTGWDTFGRWFAVMFSLGLVVSVRSALIDGPAFMVIVIAMTLVEMRRPWAAAIAFGVSGLGKETAILGAVALPVPAGRDGRVWGRWILQGVLVVLPLLLWLLHLRGLFADSHLGQGNFSLPFTGFVKKWAEVWNQELLAGGGSVFVRSQLSLFSLTVQWLFIVLRPQFHSAWWRLGAVHAVLLIVLGDAVWEGFPGGVFRVLLPMTLAFNVLVPAGRRWLPVLVLGNLSVVTSFFILGAPPVSQDAARFEGPRELMLAPATGKEIGARFDARWSEPENANGQRWRWNSGTAEMVVRNPHDFPLVAQASLSLQTIEVREVRLLVDGREYWRGRLEAGQTTRVEVSGIILPPGESVWEFATDIPGRPPAGNPADTRLLAFNLRDCVITLSRGQAPPPQ
ncbi:MAG: hypothetical protein H7Y06_12405 [Opitutaceae bacterium]|nr:hypothetical protein [Opitutaceae bacterium]